MMSNEVRFPLDEPIFSEPSTNEILVNERIVERPFVFQNLKLEKGTRILDFGCAKSKLSLELASFGYNVVGVDLEDYPFSHSNLKFVKGNFLENEFDNESFDAVVAISSIEHGGLGAYGEEKFENGDQRIVDEIYRMLKNGGRFIITIPFGIRGQTSWYRVYDDESLKTLLSAFYTEKEEYFVGIARKHWIPCTKAEISQTDSISQGYVQGVAYIVAKKPPAHL